jgi:hypothetical protein
VVKNNESVKSNFENSTRVSVQKLNILKSIG